ncbi:hypothetical protein M427DRAFT_437131 [Gonapodya prolifera JEL478]|uniref:Uncharacterized protein n=1 Tax=Gonapodya prolifera (strain JEL478) TaxID=1344416 RepID=A0A139A421_GONPJ|nr:hypothetical protein M427DRAFT_437131 [Gonapodya prolifera JEL478]|eukprot:KXS11419.1 hypothetical protein M427DRAFT_437131 [Gonapodya prolifera JEL478]
MVFEHRVVLYKEALYSVATSGDRASSSGWMRENLLRDSILADLIEEQVALGECGAVPMKGVSWRMPRLLHLALSEDVRSQPTSLSAPNATSHCESLFVGLVSMLYTSRGGLQILASDKEREATKLVGVSVARGPVRSTLRVVEERAREQVKRWKNDFGSSPDVKERLLRRGRCVGLEGQVGHYDGEFSLINGRVWGQAALVKKGQVSNILTDEGGSRDVVSREELNRRAAAALSTAA